MVAGAEHGVRAVDALERRAAGAGIALVAVARRRRRGNRCSGCAAAHCRQAIAMLRICALAASCKRLRDHREVALRCPDGRRRRPSAPARRAAARSAPLSIRPSSASLQRIDVDHARRPHHVELHQIDQRRAAGEELIGWRIGAAPLTPPDAPGWRPWRRRRARTAKGRMAQPSFILRSSPA